MSVVGKTIARILEKGRDYRVINVEGKRELLKIRIVQGNSRFVRDLTDFLNIDLDQINPDGSVEDLPWLLHSVVGMGGRGWKGKAKAIQKELKRDVISLLQAKAHREKEGLIDRLSKSFISPDARGPASCLLRLVKKLQTMDLRLSPTVQSWAPNMRSRRPLMIGGKKFVVNDDVAQNSLREEVYWFLYHSLRSATFNKLKICRNCEKIFFSNTSRQSFCPIQCKDSFHYRVRLKSGYHSKIRKVHRKRKLKIAQRVLKAGRGVRIAVEQSGLSLGILQKEGLI